jgi:hypothetical protein
MNSDRPIEHLQQYAVRKLHEGVAGRSPEIFHGERLTHLSEAERADALTWWATLSEAEKDDRREHAAKLRGNFGIPVPDSDEDWPGGEGWAAVCYEDERA